MKSAELTELRDDLKMLDWHLQIISGPEILRIGSPEFQKRRELERRLVSLAELLITTLDEELFS